MERSTVCEELNDVLDVLLTWTCCVVLPSVNILFFGYKTFHIVPIYQWRELVLTDYKEELKRVSTNSSTFKEVVRPLMSTNCLTKLFCGAGHLRQVDAGRYFAKKNPHLATRNHCLHIQSMFRHMVWWKLDTQLIVNLFIALSKSSLLSMISAKMSSEISLQLSSDESFVIHMSMLSSSDFVELSKMSPLDVLLTINLFFAICP